MASDNERSRKKREAQDIRPIWDARKGELRFRGRMEKRFRHPAPRQEWLLAAFQELRWRQRIPNPLLAGGKPNAYTALRGTLKNLNCNLRLIRFGCAEKGKFVTWMPR